MRSVSRFSGHGRVRDWRATSRRQWRLPVLLAHMFDGGDVIPVLAGAETEPCGAECMT